MVVSADENIVKNTTNNLQYLIPETIRNASTEEEITTKTKEIDKFYFNGTTPSYSNIQGYLEVSITILLDRRTFANYFIIYKMNKETGILI